jgi:hypothetical protein
MFWLYLMAVFPIVNYVVMSPPPLPVYCITGNLKIEYNTVQSMKTKRNGDGYFFLGGGGRGQGLLCM